MVSTMHGDTVHVVSRYIQCHQRARIRCHYCMLWIHLHLCDALFAPRCQSNALHQPVWQLCVDPLTRHHQV